ncbi:MAG: right-handed parallel beta-helix repeat-containing protein [Candidatus Coatesbacteria bacterium]|nr:right-handed parallel beta-helix repeat-containing protein [Candidatus Coatesbacteria bacterium]
MRNALLCAAIISIVIAGGAFIAQCGVATAAGMTSNDGAAVGTDSPNVDKRDYIPFEATAGETDYHVDGEMGDDSNDGSFENPWKTIAHALNSTAGSEAYPVTIHAAAGIYAPSTNGETYPLEVQDWTYLLGEGAALTILDAEGNQSHVVGFDGVVGAGVEGFTMTGIAEADGPWPKDLGGGIYCIDSSPDILNNLIIDNVSRRGAGIYLHTSHPTIMGNIIAGNLSTENGGGMYLFDSRPFIKNNLIYENKALNRGGGMYCLSSSSPYTWSNTIAFNIAVDGGGDGVYASPSSYPKLRECIVWGNGDDLLGCAATYSCIEDTNTGEGNIHDDPMFVSGLFGDYYLDPSSPCIDAGSTTADEAELSDLTTQADGTPDGGVVDMGFHYPLP